MPGVFSRLAQKVTRSAVPPAPKPSQAGAADPAQAAAALALGREVLHALEQFVISTPDLDSGRFLQRVRGTAAGLVPQADPTTLQLYRQWARNALGVFADLQRRYVAEREDEMWRLLDTYLRAAETGRSNGGSLLGELKASHQRVRDMASLPDLRTEREKLEEEVRKAQRLVELKVREDKERLAGLAREVSRLEATLAAVKGQANYDALTGILHRGAFNERFEELVSEGKLCSVAILDVDNFKTINDTLGHPVGDRVLTLVADQLRRVARSSDLVARWGGDEYCFVAAGFTPEQLSQRLMGAVSKRHVRLEMEERACSVLLSLSVGIASSRQGDTPAALLHRADQALLIAKRGGKGDIRVAPSISGRQAHDADA